MARKRKSTPRAPVAISASELEHVVGGRVASISKGPSPEVIQGVKALTESVAALGQKRAADQAGQAQMMQQVMQQMMGRR